jgi:DNA-binding CsgD family transcriptional regulator
MESAFVQRLSAPPQVRPETRVRVPQHVVHRAFPARTVVLNLETGKYHGLNPTAGRMLTALEQGLRAPLESEALSMREKQILGMVVMGFTNADIAAELFVAESTVKSHLSSAYTKLGVSSRREATTLILDPTQGLGPGIFAIAVGTGAAWSAMVAESRSRRSSVAPEADGSSTSGAEGARPPADRRRDHGTHAPPRVTSV